MMERVSEEAFNEVEADAYHCMTNMLDNAQVRSRVAEIGSNVGPWKALQ